MTQSAGLKDYEERIRLIRAQMKPRGLEALIIYSQRRGHVCYVSGYRPNYHTNSAVVLLPAAGELALWIKFPFDMPRAKASSWIEDIRPSAREENEHLLTQCAEEIRSRGLERSRLGVVASDLAVDELSHSMWLHLSAQLPKAEIVPASDLLHQVRLIKSEAEIELLRQATQLGDQVAERLKSAIRTGRTEHQAAVEAAQAARLEGGECDILISSDPARMALPPGGHEFKPGRSITCEITVQLANYWIQICRVYSIGKASPEHREIFSVCSKAYRATAQSARPGKKVSEMLGAAHQAIADGGYKDYIQYGPGHGIGLDLPELYPLDSSCHAAIAPGMIFIIHPAIWVPQQGAAFVGGPVVVPQDGAPIIQLDKPQSEIFEL
jgi:Xaa-Pro aminopeptidase